jgi:hypothetical protein
MLDCRGTPPVKERCILRLPFAQQQQIEQHLLRLQCSKRQETEMLQFFIALHIVEPKK